ncbi:MAG: hypothetical protein C5B60_06360 [Chloroflexi bacterium]|nr:MAG: hypothetical protein C5B60_06360 [Chloroflexota bacterium]
MGGKHDPKEEGDDLIYQSQSFNPEAVADTAEADLRDVERDIVAAETDAETAKTKAAQVQQQADNQAGTP